ncbi:multicopper oxidase domain-containing protein [Histophilus somni]|uniref:multicopper oxidase domain-containing protein n=1 Tax=Histophilus somni TaxID=731 RepID=UPI00094AEA64|nr:multicopper oxidase domain-containing protein [Histophilus somni]
MRSLTRRDFLKSGILASSLSCIPQSVMAASRLPLFIPPLLEAKRGRPIFLTMQAAQTSFIEKKLTEVWGFNGHHLGPTVRVEQGDFVKLNYRNNLTQAVAMNIQGLQAHSELIGGIGRVLKAGEGWAPILPITQPASTCFYHACTLANSAYQTYRGLVGMWIINDKDTHQSKLPKKYGVDDIPLILQDVLLNSKGEQVFQNQPHFLGERLLVNGVEAPYLNVPKGLVRLRLLNASLSRSYDLTFDDERAFFLIAREQGYLPQTKIVKKVSLAPSERVELLVDLSEGGNATLITGSKRNLLNKIGTIFSSDMLVDNVIVELRTEGVKSVFYNPSHWQFHTDAPSLLAKKNMKTREFYFDVSNATINQQRFEPNRIDISTKRGQIERWILSSSRPVGFKIQGARFVMKSINDQPVEQSDIAWKDSLWIDGKVEILVQFNHASSTKFPFIFGSSDLVLADQGCLGSIVVQ